MIWEGVIVTVWSTTQSAIYTRDTEDDFCGDENELHDKIRWDERAEREKPDRSAPRSECSQNPAKPTKRGLLDDSDTLVILALIMLLMREKADSKLLLALLLVIL